MLRKHFISVLLCSVAVFASCTDVWEEHYQADPQLNAEETLWDLIKNDPDLDMFEKFLKATHYDSLLMKDRFYTVWAPVGDFTYNETDLEILEKEFVQNHIANYSHVAGGKLAEDNFVTMLNGKYMRFENSKGKFTFKGLPLEEENIPAKNGILHKIEGYADFTPNIWEQLAKEKGVDSLYKFLLKDYKREFNQYSSVQGPTVDGQVTYLDSVFTESNPWFNDLGELNREDSSYTMFALTNTAWKEMYDMASTYFHYSDAYKTQGGDSVRDQIVKELMCKNLVFSNKVNAKYLNGNTEVPYDTLLSNYKLYYGYKPLAFAGDDVAALYRGATTKQLSNGTLHVVDQVNYRPLMCWHDTIRSEAESLKGVSSDEKDVDYNYYADYVKKTAVYVDEDSVELYNDLSGGAIASFEPNNASEFDIYFDVKNVLSAPYRIKIVTVPPQKVNPSDTLYIRPTRFTAQLSFGSDEGKDVSAAIQLGANFGNDSIMLTNCEDIDTIVLCPRDGSGRDYVTIPVCEFEETSRFNEAKLQTKLKISMTASSMLSRLKSEYLIVKRALVDGQMRLNVAKNELLLAEEQYQAVLEDMDATPDLVEEYLEKKNACESNVAELEENVAELDAEVKWYEGDSDENQYNYVEFDNVLRIDQVIFEPINPEEE